MDIKGILKNKVFLDEENLEIIMEYNTGFHKVDMYLPKFNLIVEADGDAHKAGG